MFKLCFYLECATFFFISGEIHVLICLFICFCHRKTDRICGRSSFYYCQNISGRGHVKLASCFSNSPLIFSFCHILTLVKQNSVLKAGSLTTDRFFFQVFTNHHILSLDLLDNSPGKYTFSMNLPLSYG